MRNSEHLISMSKAKFFYAETKFSLAEIVRIRQYPRGRSRYIGERFHDKALDCSDPLEERTLVDICLRGMLEECRIFLENLSFSSFFKLMEATRLTSETICRAP